MTEVVPAAARHWWSITRAPAAIYGSIIGGSVMAASDTGTPVGEVALTVVGTLLVYWLAERWSVVLGTHLVGRPLGWARARRIFAEGWPMVQVSYVPLIVMLVVWAAGAGDDTAVGVALIATIVLLVWLGVLAGRRAGLGRWGVVGAAAFTGALGLALVLLKAVVQH